MLLVVGIMGGIIGGSLTASVFAVGLFFLIRKVVRK